MIERSLIELALSRLVGSEQLRRSPQLVAMLEYIVKQKLLGNDNRIKAYSIAIDALNRPDNFDPSIDPIVRTQAKRLRRLMKTYYETDIGQQDDIRIIIPRGGYIPKFVRSEELLKERLHRRRRTLVKFSAVAMLFVIFIGGAIFWSSLSTSNGIRPSVLRIFVEHESDNSLERFMALKIADIVSRFSRTDVIWNEQNKEPHSQIWPEDYHIKVTSVTNNNQIILDTFVTHVKSNEIIYSHNTIIHRYQSKELSKANIRELEIVMARLLQNHGTILADYVMRADYSPLMTCLIATDTYFRNSTVEHHYVARTCAEKLIASGVEHSSLQVVLSLMFKEQHTEQRNQRLENPMEKALQAATNAIQLQPTSAHAHYAMMAVHSIMGNDAGFLEEGRTSVSLNPIDGENIAGFAFQLNIHGFHKKALKYLARAQELQLVSSNWRHYAFFLAEYGMGNIDKAIARSRSLIGSSTPLHLAALAIAAKHQNNITEARRLLAILIQQVGKEIDDLRQMYKRRNYSPKLVNRIISDLYPIYVHSEIIHAPARQTKKFD